MKKISETLSLGYSLAKANFKVRNEGSYLGILWYLLNPLCFFLIILYIRGALVPTETIDQYPLYLLMGLTMLNFFSQVIRSSVSLIEANSGIIKSIKIPYEIFVISTLLQAVFSHAFEVLLMAAFFLYFHVPLVGMLLYAVVFVFYAAFALGLSFLATTIGLYFSDLENVWAVVSQLLLFLTPVFYLVSPGTRLYAANLLDPFFYFMTVARDAAIYRTLPPAWMSLTAVGVSLASCAVGILVFETCKGRFAEYV